LWPPKTGEEPWTCIFFLGELQPVYIPIGEVAAFAGYSPTSFIVQGFMPLNQEGVERILAKFGTLEQFLAHYSVSSKEVIKMQASPETPSAEIAELQKRIQLRRDFIM
jgi:hypothetical protein